MRSRVLCYALFGMAPLFAQAPHFYADDPLWVLPQPLPVESAKFRKISDVYDLFYNQLGRPGEHQPESGPKIRAQGINTLGEVPDSEWYVNRHYRRRMSLSELKQGPAGQPPDMSSKWTVVAAKSEGVTPGFTVTDATGRRFVLKFDPAGYPELATSADVIGSRFFYALGYHVPVNHIVYFTKEQLELGEGTQLLDRQGRRRKMTSQDLWDVLGQVHSDKDGRYRAVASLYLTGQPVGPRRWHGTRRDDPNDIVPHEHRRDLRGMRIFAAWLGHDDSRAINSLDMLVEDGVPHIRHFLIDFGSTLGSASNGPNSPRSGHVPLFSWDETAKEFFTFGLYIPDWSKAHFPQYPSIGRFEYERFDPERWVPEYSNPAFANMLPDDAFWAARQVTAFTDEEIRTIVQTGQLSDPAAEAWLVECLIKRRDKIGRAWLTKVLPFDRFRVENNQLVFDDVAARHGIGGERSRTVRWSRLGGGSGVISESAALPPVWEGMRAGEILAADVGDSRLAIRAYVRKTAEGAQVVGLERRWEPERKPSTAGSKTGARASR